MDIQRAALSIELNYGDLASSEAGRAPLPLPGNGGSASPHHHQAKPVQPVQTPVGDVANEDTENDDVVDGEYTEGAEPEQAPLTEI